MTPQEFKKFIDTLKAIVPMGAPEFDSHQLSAWYMAFQQFDAQKLFALFPQLSATCERFPSIKQILDLLDPKPDADAEARGIADRIYGAMSRWGSLRSKQDAIRDHIGPVGWRVVQECGGWLALCEICTLDNAATLKAQWRESAKALLALDDVNKRRDHLGLPAYQGASLPVTGAKPELSGKPETFDLTRVLTGIETRVVK